MPHNFWTVSYHKGANHLLLYTIPYHISYFEDVVGNKFVTRLLTRFTWGYRLWNKALIWTDDHYTEVFRMEIGPDVLQDIAKDDEWLWGDDADE